MLEADEILSNGFATMGPILNGVMAVHLFNNRSCERLGLLKYDSGDGVDIPTRSHDVLGLCHDGAGCWP